MGGVVSDVFGGGSGASDSKSFEERFRVAAPQIGGMLQAATGLYNMGPTPYVSQYVGADQMQNAAYQAGGMLNAMNPNQYNQQASAGNFLQYAAPSYIRDNVAPMQDEISAYAKQGPQWDEGLATQVRGWASDNPYLDQQVADMRQNAETARKQQNIQNDFGAGFGGGLGSSYAALMNAKTNMDANTAMNQAETGMRGDIYKMATGMGHQTAHDYGLNRYQGGLEGLNTAANLGMGIGNAYGAAGRDLSNQAREGFKFEQMQRLGLGEMMRNMAQEQRQDFTNYIRYPWMAEQERLGALKNIVDSQGGFSSSQRTGDQAGALGSLFGGVGAVSGALGSGSVGSLFALSDSRLKENVKTVSYMGDLPVVTWTWNANAEEEFGLKGDSIGFIAQDVAERYPEFVEEIDGFLGIHYLGLLGILTDNGEDA